MAAPPVSTCASDAPSETRKRKLDLEFDYETVKFQYLKKFDDFFSYAEFRTKPTSSNAVDRYIRDLKLGVKRGQSHEVIERDGKDVLILKRHHADDPIIQVVGAEDAFDIIMEAHIATDHGDYRTMGKILGLEYRLPNPCVYFFPKLCNVCISKSRTKKKKSPTCLLNPAVPFNRACQVHIIHITPPDDNFRYMLIYLDVATNFIILRPMIALSATEASIELLKIFADFGTPMLMKVYDNLSLFKEAMQELGNMWPTKKVVLKNLTRLDTHGRVRGTAVMSMIKTWMGTSNSTNWAVACHMIQWQLNNTAVTQTVKTPYVSVFGVEPSQINVYGYGHKDTNTNRVEESEASSSLLVTVSDNDSNEEPATELPMELYNADPETLIVKLEESSDEDDTKKIVKLEESSDEDDTKKIVKLEESSDEDDTKNPESFAETESAQILLITKSTELDPPQVNTKGPKTLVVKLEENCDENDADSQESFAKFKSAKDDLDTTVNTNEDTQTYQLGIAEVDDQIYKNPSVMQDGSEALVTTDAQIVTISDSNKINDADEVVRPVDITKSAMSCHECNKEITNEDIHCTSCERPIHSYCGLSSETVDEKFKYMIQVLCDTCDAKQKIK